MDNLLRELLDALDAVGEKHGEIYDTVCRERMGEAIFYLFVKPDSGYVTPNEFGLYDDDANRDVKHALVTYSTAAREMAPKSGIDSFHGRLAAFQNEEIKGNKEQNYYDDFFGWSNPENFDADGNVVDDPK
jgi:hypothetical protein